MIFIDNYHTIISWSYYFVIWNPAAIRTCMEAFLKAFRCFAYAAFFFVALQTYTTTRSTGYIPSRVIKRGNGKSLNKNGCNWRLIRLMMTMVKREFYTPFLPVINPMENPKNWRSSQWDLIAGRIIEMGWFSSMEGMNLVLGTGHVLMEIDHFPICWPWKNGVSHPAGCVSTSTRHNDFIRNLNALFLIYMYIYVYIYIHVHTVTY